MLRLAADENFNNNVIRGLLRRVPALDIVRIQDVGLSGADDPSVLEWAALEGRESRVGACECYNVVDVVMDYLVVKSCHFPTKKNGAVSSKVQTLWYNNLLK